MRVKLIAASLCGVLIVLCGITRVSSDEATSDEYYELMKVFVDTFQQIDRNYVKDVDRKQLVEAAVKGMLDKLDPYSDYISPDDLSKFTEAVEAEFGGVGIHVNYDEEQKNIEILMTVPGGPAAQAGIKAGDRIVAMEGKPVKDFPKQQEIETAITYLKGEVGKEVKVEVKHPDKDNPETFTLKRAIIKLDTVLGDSRNADGTWNYWLEPEKKVAYLRLTNFAGRSGEEMQHVLQTLKKEGMKALILDLRNNPGGKLEAAVEISDLFLDSGLIVSTEGRNSLPQKFAAKRYGTFSGFPMAVLVNRYSASASEIVSAALQDHKRAIVVGERSWGKGSVQTVIDMNVEGSKAALKLTTAAYHRPSGKNIHRFPDAKDSDEWGVSPDEGYKVMFSPQEMRAWNIVRAHRDSLRASKEPADIDFTDTQLKKAEDYIDEQLKKPADAPEPKDEKAEKDKEKEQTEPEVKKEEKKTSSVKPYVPLSDAA
jgi:carboxyl-terminal processing protease